MSTPDATPPQGADSPSGASGTAGDSSGHTPRRGLLRRTYDWVLMLSRRPNAERALSLLAFAESMIFPIPPDVMLIPMCVARPKRSLRFAANCSVASVLGGMAGYAIGLFMWGAVGAWFFANVPGFSEEKFASIGSLYEEYSFWIVFAAGFTPIPYKIITISAGVFGIPFLPFVVASFIGRAGRFFLVAGLLWKWGEEAQAFIEKYFNLLAVAFVTLLVGGFWLIAQH